MGNASFLPFRAAHEESSRDTHRGAAQLTDAQKEEVRAQDPVTIVAPNPKITLEQALGGYTGTGHSPMDAT